MKRMPKYLLIIYSVLIILTILGYTFEALYENYAKTHVPETQYDSNGPMPSLKPTSSPYYYLNQLVGFLGFIILPIFIIFMSALYLYKEKQGYFKSLLIPLSFVIIGFILSFIWLKSFAVGEEGMAVLYIWLMLLSTIILSSILNVIVLAIVKKQIS